MSETNRPSVSDEQHGDRMFDLYKKQVIDGCVGIEFVSDRAAWQLLSDAQRESSPVLSEVHIDIIHDPQAEPFIRSHIQPVISERIHDYRTRVGLLPEEELYFPKLTFMDDRVTEEQIGDNSFVAAQLFSEGAVGISVSRLIRLLQRTRSFRDVDSVFNMIGDTYLSHLYQVNRIYKQIDRHHIALGAVDIISLFPLNNPDPENEFLERLYTVNRCRIDALIYPYETLRNQRNHGAVNSAVQSSEYPEPNANIYDATEDFLVEQSFNWLSKIHQFTNADYQQAIRYSPLVQHRADADQVSAYPVLPMTIVSDRSMLEGQMTVVVDPEGFLKPVVFGDTQLKTQEEYTERIFDYLVFLDPRCIYALQEYVKNPMSLSEAMAHTHVFRQLIGHAKHLESIWNKPYPMHNVSLLKKLYHTLKCEVEEMVFVRT
jgi:hypothetical protein